MKYQDLNGIPCELSFKKGKFSIPSRHVLVICKSEGSWVLTEHPLRGLEFPGGKVEPGESLEDAAAREVYEETGAIVTDLEWLAEYMVYSDAPFCKTVLTAKVKKIDTICLLETKGIVLSERLEIDDRFSFLMKDEGMEEIMKRVKRLGKWDN